MAAARLVCANVYAFADLFDDFCANSNIEELEEIIEGIFRKKLMFTGDIRELVQAQTTAASTKTPSWVFLRRC